MRLPTLTTIFLSTLALAQPQQQNAYPAADSSVMITLTLTRTVERVVETTTATRNISHSTTASPPLGTASMGVLPQGNGTSTVLGTGAGPSESFTSGSVPTGTGAPESGAERVGLEMFGLMAVVGLVGLAGL